MPFRADINGLRAIAVASVLLYHFKVSGFAGGFVGVDIFLVISGFLMTQILMHNIEQGDYDAHAFQSIIKFYRRRSLRIIPALAVLSLVMLAAGWYVLIAEDYLYLGSEIAFALLFLSNYKYYSNAEGDTVGGGVGYFADTDYTRWLLHSWSLSVEWQFYIIYPFLLWLIWRFVRNQTIFAFCLVLFSVASFLINIALVRINSELAFYSLPTRAWEFTVGGLVFLLGRMYPIRRGWQEIVVYFGLALIGFSVFFAFDAARWPGWGASIPVMATAIVIAANRNDAWVLSNPLSQGLGLISYSLYLWHWPVVMALQHLYVPHTYLTTLAGVCAALLLAMLSYFLVERRALSLSGGGRPVVAWAVVAALVAVLGGLAAYVRLDAGIPERMSRQVVEILHEKQNINPRRTECHLLGVTRAPECHYGGQQLGIILTGDSHAASIARTLEGSLRTRAQYVLDLTTVGCPIILGANGTRKEFRCAEFADYVATRLRQLPASIPLVIASRASYYVYGPNEAVKEPHKPLIKFGDNNSGRSLEAIYQERVIFTLCEFAKRRPVYLLRPIPELKISAPTFVARRTMAGLSSDISIPIEEYEKRHRFVLDVQRQAAAECGIKLLDPVPYLCSDGRCRGTRDGLPLYFDDDHLSERGARLLLPLFSAIYPAVAASPAPVSLNKSGHAD